MTEPRAALVAEDGVAAAIRVVVADDHPRHRRNVTRMLSATDGFHVVGEAEDVDGAAAECVRCSPDVLVMADELPGASGLSGVRRIHALRPGCAIVLLSLRAEAERSEKARDGAVALCLDKVADPRTIVEALRAMLRERPAPVARDSAPALDPLALGPPHDLATHRRLIAAEALHQGERFDPHLVEMTLLLDQGEHSVGGRWAEVRERVDRLDAVLGARDESVYVLLGEGGSGKTMLLRRLAVDAATAARGPAPDAPDAADAAPVPFFVPLGRYGPLAAGEPAPEAADWLNGLWSARGPVLPRLSDLATRGQLVLLLDGLNEMRLGSEAAHRSGIESWARLAQHVAAAHPANRVVFSSRSLESAQHLSTAQLRVPLLRLEPVAVDRIREHLEARAPRAWEKLWPALAESAEIEVLRRPYYLDLFATQLQGGGTPQVGGAALITAFVRRALERETSQANPHLATHSLLAEDDRRRIAGGRWRSPWELPEGGRLVDGLVRLADRMLRAHERTSYALVWLPEQDALDAVGGALGSAVLGAGQDIDVLARDPASGDVAFRHQILQDYFAARRLSKAPEPELAYVEWRAEHVAPGIDEVLDGLDPADALPPLPSTAWDNALLLATQMADDPAAYLHDLAEGNLTLAGTIAARPEVRPLLPEDLVVRLRWSLVQRSRDPATDLRERIAAGGALGGLGDPRLEQRTGLHGAYLVPPLAEIPGGVYPIGHDEEIRYAEHSTADHVPGHTVVLAPFRIGRFPVTNAEYACFIAAGGYEDERWWDTAAGTAWRQGVGTAAGGRHNFRVWRQVFREKPATMAVYVEQGVWTPLDHANWRSRVEMSDTEFEAHLEEVYPERRLTQPRYWEDARFSGPMRPVVGVCWFEARAYAAWLAALTGKGFRLPTEAEWESAARGIHGRTYAYGNDFRPLNGNLIESRVKKPSPVGVFVEGDTPEGVSDLTGNVWEWTSSAYDRDTADSEPGAGRLFSYPYRADDGREEPDAEPDVRRVMRGGSWQNNQATHAVVRINPMPSNTAPTYGFRLAASTGVGDRQP